MKMKIKDKKSVYQKQALAVTRLTAYIATKIGIAEMADDSMSKHAWVKSHMELRRKISAMDLPQYGNVSLIDAFHMMSVERVRAYMELT